jgi:hypothetical protein
LIARSKKTKIPSQKKKKLVAELALFGTRPAKQETRAQTLARKHATEDLA